MDIRDLGKTGPRVSVVGLGCNNFGWRIDVEASRKVVDKAIDLGVTPLDTADMYGEDRIGGLEIFVGKKTVQVTYSGDIAATLMPCHG